MNSSENGQMGTVQPPVGGQPTQVAYQQPNVVYYQMPRKSLTQKQILFIGAVVLILIGVVIYFVTKPKVLTCTDVYTYYDGTVRTTTVTYKFNHSGTQLKSAKATVTRNYPSTMDASEIAEEYQDAETECNATNLINGSSCKLKREGNTITMETSVKNAALAQAVSASTATTYDALRQELIEDEYSCQ